MGQRLLHAICVVPLIIFLLYLVDMLLPGRVQEVPILNKSISRGRYVSYNILYSENSALRSAKVSGAIYRAFAPRDKAFLSRSHLFSRVKAARTQSGPWLLNDPQFIRGILLLIVALITGHGSRRNADIKAAQAAVLLFFCCFSVMLLMM